MGGGVEAVRELAAAGAVGAFAGLCGVGVLCWWRTAPLRRGRTDGKVGPPHGRLASSPSTWLAAASGASFLAWGASSLHRSPALGGVAALSGAFVTVSGIRSRVVAIEVGTDRLIVRRAFRAPLEVAWDRLAEIRAPATPIGGWRFLAEGCPVTLMPSDLLLNEAVIRLAIDRAGLRPEGRRWIRPP